MVCYTGLISGHDSSETALKALKMQAEEVAQGAFLPPATWFHLLPQAVRFPIGELVEHRVPMTASLASMKLDDSTSVYVQGEVEASTVAEGLGGGHQFALYHLAVTNQADMSNPQSPIHGLSTP